MIYLMMIAAALGDGSVSLEPPLTVYQTCVTKAAERLAPLVKTSGPQSGEESDQVAEQAVASCLVERAALKAAAVARLRLNPEYKGRGDLEVQAEMALQPFDAMIKDDARMNALLAFGNRK